MIDLEKLVQDSLKGMFESGKIVEIIDKHTEALVNGVVRDALSTYSEFGKQLSASLSEALKVDVGSIGLPEYNHIVLAIVRRKLEHAIEETGRKQIETDLAAMLSHPVPAEITLTKFIDDFKEWAREDRGIEEYEEGEVTAFLDEKKYSSQWLYLSRNANTEMFRCDFGILIGEDGKMRAVHFHGKDSEKSLFLGRLHGFERTVFHMHVAKTRIIVDGHEDIDNQIYSKHS